VVSEHKLAIISDYGRLFIPQFIEYNEPILAQFKVDKWPQTIARTGLDMKLVVFAFKKDGVLD